MTLHYRLDGDSIVVFGRTYPHRDAIRALGGRFRKADKNWSLSRSDLAVDQIDKLCRRAGGGLLSEPDQPITPKEPVATTEGSQGLTISQLMDQVQLAIGAQFPEQVWVCGEVQNVNLRAMGVFLTLAEPKDSGTSQGSLTANATIWQDALKRMTKKHGQKTIDETIEEGLKLRCLCRVGLYRDRGSVSLSIVDIDPSFTKGSLALAREALLKDLRDKGLDEANRKQPMPHFPLRVGLVSAEGSRAEGDFLHQLWDQGFPGEVIYCPSSMQGERVPEDICRALEQLTQRDCDLIVITRGGGSAADLRWFDDPKVAYAIAQSSLPIIAAIGHHDDVCVAEEICFRRQKTPTAAADFVVGLFRERGQQLRDCSSTLGTHLNRAWELHRRRVENQVERLATGTIQTLRAADARLAELGHRLEMTFFERHRISLQHLGQVRERLGIEAQQLLHTRLTEIAKFEKALVSHDPKPWLKAGWTQLFGPQGVVHETSSVTKGDDVMARLIDGNLHLKVDKIEPRKEKPHHG